LKSELYQKPSKKEIVGRGKRKKTRVLKSIEKGERDQHQPVDARLLS